MAANEDALNPDKQEERKANSRNQRQNGGVLTEKVRVVPAWALGARAFAPFLQFSTHTNLCLAPSQGREIAPLPLADPSHSLWPLPHNPPGRSLTLPLADPSHSLRQEREIATRRHALKEQLGAMWSAFSAHRQVIIRRPLWRHRLMGEFSPPPGEVLRGATYLRLVTMSLIVVYIRPNLIIMKVPRYLIQYLKYFQYMIPIYARFISTPDSYLLQSTPDPYLFRST